MKILKSVFNNWYTLFYYNKGLVFYKKRQWDKALYAFEQGYKNNPKHSKNVFKLGLCHLKLTQYSEAYQYISQALELNSKNISWKKQFDQCVRHLDNSPVGTEQVVTRVLQGNSKRSIGLNLKKNLLLIPSDYNHRVLADIFPFIEFYKNNFNIYIILREATDDIVYKNTHTIVRNGTPFAEYLKFTADYVIDAGTINYSYRITDTNKWVSVWHGIPYKKMFVDLDINHLSTAIRYNLAYDIMISMSDFYTKTFLENALQYDGRILQLGCAKIDYLLDNNFSSTNQEIRNKLIEKFKLPKDKKFILYTPEFRLENNILPFDYHKLLEHLDDKYSFICVSKYIEKIKGNNIYFIPDLSDIEALILTDILISDYNPLIYHFDRYNKPVILFHHDFSEFLQNNLERERELNILASRFYVVKNTDELIALNWCELIKSSIENSVVENLVKLDIFYQLGIPVDKKVVLYAPTYRNAGAVTLPFNSEKLLKKLNNKYVLVIKMHYLNYLNHHNNDDNVFDCTEYFSMPDLMKISDILISDYSSLVLDYAVLNKPIVLFQYDYDEYMQKRGTYFSFEDYLPIEQIVKDEHGLYQLNWSNLISDNRKITNYFYPLEDGQSTKRIVEAICFDGSNRQCKDIIFLVNELNQIGGVHTFLKNMAKYYKKKYNARIFVIAIKEFAESNSEFYLLESPYIDFKLSSQYLAGACTSILQNTDGLVISLQFSAHLHFQKYLAKAKSVLMFHGDVKDVISKEIYEWHLDALNTNKLINYEKFLLLTESAVKLLEPHLQPEIKNKVGFINNSIDAEFIPITCKSNLHTAVISRLDADKNIFAIIDLGKEIRAKNEKVVVSVYGDGKLKNDFIAEIEKHQLQHIIVVKGFESDKKKIFSENDSLLLMSKSEGFPLVILEAYGYGKPVIVFDSFTAAKDVVNNQKSGFLLPYGDYAGVIDAVYQCEQLKSDDILEKFSQFSNETVFNQWNKLIMELDEL